MHLMHSFLVVLLLMRCVASLVKISLLTVAIAPHFNPTIAFKDKQICMTWGSAFNVDLTSSNRSSVLPVFLRYTSDPHFMMTQKTLFNQL